MLRTALLALLMIGGAPALAAPPQWCPRPASGETVPEPEDLRSTDGVLSVDLYAHNTRPGKAAPRYCYQLADGTQSPTLRLRPGELLILRLHNELVANATPSTIRAPEAPPRTWAELKP